MFRQRLSRGQELTNSLAQRRRGKDQRIQSFVVPKLSEVEADRRAFAMQIPLDGVDQPRDPGLEPGDESLLAGKFRGRVFRIGEFLGRFPLLLRERIATGTAEMGVAAMRFGGRA